MSQKARLELHNKALKRWSIEVHGSTATTQREVDGGDPETNVEHFNSAKEAEAAAWEQACAKAREGFRVVEGPQKFRQLNIAIPTAYEWGPAFIPDMVSEVASSKKIRDALVNIEPPSAVKRMLRGMDELAKTGGVLTVEDAIDLGAAAFLLTHENSGELKEIRLERWQEMDIAWVKENCAEDCELFNKLFTIDVPEQLFEIQLYYECMAEVLSGRYPFREFHESFSISEGIFRNVFGTWKPEEAHCISHRYLHDPCVYFPTWATGTYQVNYGVIFDQVENCFAPMICGGYKSEYYVSSLWTEFENSFSDSLDPGYELEEFETFAEHSVKDFDSLDEESLGYDLCRMLEAWVLSFATIGFLNSKQIKGLEIRPEAEDRYRQYYEWKKESTRDVRPVVRCNYEIFPNPIFEFDDRFNPALSKRFIEALLIWLSNEGFATEYFDYKRPAQEVLLEEYPAEMKLLGFRPEDIGDESTDRTSVLIECVEAFCLNELKEERPVLPYLVAIHAWNDCLSLDREAKTAMAANLMQGLPDEYCHPLIKLVATRHAPTRFHDTIPA